MCSGACQEDGGLGGQQTEIKKRTYISGTPMLEIFFSSSYPFLSCPLSN